MLTSRSNSGLQVSGIFLDISHIGSNDITENQITPFSFSTPDNETLYAWHVMPLGLYAKHEAELLREPSGFAEDITRTKPFKLMTDSPETKLVIYCKHMKGIIRLQSWLTHAMFCSSWSKYCLNESHIYLG
jgi:hypothetical protein